MDLCQPEEALFLLVISLRKILKISRRQSLHSHRVLEHPTNYFTVCKKCEGISGPSVSVLPTSRMVDMPLIFASHRVVCRCGLLADRFGEVTMLFAGIQDKTMKAAEA